MPSGETTMTGRFSLNHVAILVVRLLLLVLSLVASEPIFADTLTLSGGACGTVSISSGNALQNCNTFQTVYTSAGYSQFGTLNGPVRGPNPPGIFGIEATVVQLPCDPSKVPEAGCGAFVSSFAEVTYNFGGLGVASGFVKFGTTALGIIYGPINAQSAELEVSPF